MSALRPAWGQNRKRFCLSGMSVLPSRADIVRPPRHVRLVPKAEVKEMSKWRSEANAPPRPWGDGGALGKMVRGKQGLVSLQGPTPRSNRGDDDLTRQFYEQSRSTVYFAVITAPHAAYSLRRPGGAFLTRDWFNQWAFKCTEARVRPSDFAIVSTPTFASAKRRKRRTSSSVHRKRVLLPVICF